MIEGKREIGRDPGGLRPLRGIPTCISLSLEGVRSVLEKLYSTLPTDYFDRLGIPQPVRLQSVSGIKKP